MDKKIKNKLVRILINLYIRRNEKYGKYNMQNNRKNNT